jgi:hypothetical protein
MSQASLKPTLNFTKHRVSLHLIERHSEFAIATP